MSKKLKPRDKVTQKMSRDGLIEVNETAGTAELVSGREQDADFPSSPNRRRRKQRSSFRTHPAARQLVPIPRSFLRSGATPQPSVFWSISTLPIPAQHPKRR